MKRFDYATIAGRNPFLYASHVDNVLRNAGLERDLWNFHTIFYRNSKIDKGITDQLVEIANKNNIHYEFYDEVEGGGFETFLHNLYVCWNRCQTIGDTPLNVRAGSDQAFSRNAFKNMMYAWDFYTEEHDDRVVLFHNLIECKKRVGNNSRHILENFGDSWDTFDEEAFQSWCDDNSMDEIVGFELANARWGAPRNMPGLSSNNRADGASWIMSKKLFNEFGPMLPRNAGGLTGDIYIMNKMHGTGVALRIIGNSHTYHISQGDRE